MLRCGMRLKFLALTHVVLPSAEEICCLFECSDALQCLALLPPPGSSAADYSCMLYTPEVWPVHESFADVVVVTEWDELDVLLDMWVPGVCVCLSLSVYIYLYVYLYIYTHMYTHTHTHTHSRTRLLPRRRQRVIEHS